MEADGIKLDPDAWRINGCSPHAAQGGRFCFLTGLERSSLCRAAFPFLRTHPFWDPLLGQHDKLGGCAFFSGEHMRPACGLQRPAATPFFVPSWQRRKRAQNWQHCAKFAEAGRLSQHSRRVCSPEIAILSTAGSGLKCHILGLVHMGRLDGHADPAARGELAADFHLPRMARLDEIIEDPVSRSPR